jgi:hypothetical protein
LLYLGLAISKERALFCKCLAAVDISEDVVDLFHKRDVQNIHDVCAELKGSLANLITRGSM